MTGIVCAPMRVEAAALRAPGMRVVHTGMGPRRAAESAGRLADTPVVVAGVAGAVTGRVRPGDLVVATEIDGADGPVPLPSAPLLAAALRRHGLTVHTGPITSSDVLVEGAGRVRLAERGALAVDMESAQFASVPVPLAVVRSIVDTPGHPLWRPGTVLRGISGLRSLRAAAPALREWCEAAGAGEILLASATTNRQAALRAVAEHADLVLVVGSGNSSNSKGLVEVARRLGAPAHLVDDVSEVDLRWLAGAPRIGITAGASAPPHLVEKLIRCLAGLGRSVSESRVADEDVQFSSPREVG